jgi:hypothetical protein
MMRIASCISGVVDSFAGTRFASVVTLTREDLRPLSGHRPMSPPAGWPSGPGGNIITIQYTSTIRF